MKAHKHPLPLPLTLVSTVNAVFLIAAGIVIAILDSNNRSHSQKKKVPFETSRPPLPLREYHHLFVPIVTQMRFL